MLDFEYPDDKEYFEILLKCKNDLKIENFAGLFDFRSPETKRKEFNQIRSKILIELSDLYGTDCMLKLDCCDLKSGTAIDHLIPLSSNILNKKLRNQKAEPGKKVRTQSIGSNHIDNLLIACNKCNNHKKHKFLDPENLEKIFISKLEMRRK